MLILEAGDLNGVQSGRTAVQVSEQYWGGAFREVCNRGVSDSSSMKRPSEERHLENCWRAVVSRSLNWYQGLEKGSVLVLKW